MIAQLDRDYVLSRPSKIYQRLLSYFFYEGRPATTRGRWFNPVTFSVLRAASSGNLLAAAESPLFITGTGRSGSTILGKILSLHPDTGFLNEPKALWFTANKRDDLIGSYSGENADYIMGHSQYSTDMARKIKAMYSSYLKKSRTSFILDKYPEMIFRIGLLNAVFRNPKYILLHRDAFDTVSSTAAWSQQHSGNNEDWWGVNKRKWKLLIEQVLPGSALLKEHIPVISEFTAGPDMAAVEWIVTMEYGIKMLQQFPDKILPVSYEALCTSPEIALEKISAFAGWSPDEKMKQYAKRVLKNLPAKTKPVMHDILYEPISKLTRELEICS